MIGPPPLSANQRLAYEAQAQASGIPLESPVAECLRQIDHVHGWVDPRAIFGTAPPPLTAFERRAEAWRMFDRQWDLSLRPDLRSAILPPLDVLHLMRRQ